MQRTLLLLVVFIVFCIKISAHPITSILSDRAVAGYSPVENLPEINLPSESVYPGYAIAKLIPPVITLTVNDFESRIAQLSWTTSDPLIGGTYFIERQVASSGIWDPLAQLPYNAVLYYEDTISHPYCTITSFEYRVRFVTITPETGISNVPAPVSLFDFKNNPELISDLVVSINSNREPELYWKKVINDDIQAYEIRRFNGFNWTTITTLPADSGHYVDKTVPDGCNTSYEYAIYTVDRCGNKNADFPEDVSVQTIVLNLPVIGDCERLAKLSWNPYSHIPDGLGGYKVYRMVDYAAPVEVVNIKDTLITAYNDAFNFENGHTYTYYVEAYNADSVYSSYSCQLGWKYTGANVADSIYISSVSVNNDSYIGVMYYSNPDETVKSLVLERSDDGGASFHTVDSAFVTIGFMPQQGTLNDTSADVHSQSYYYRLVAIDFCGTNRIYSNISRSIFLQCSATETENSLDWNSYESWLQGVDVYQIYRTMNGEPASGELIASIDPPAITSFSDPFTNIDPNKEACYYVRTQENPGNPYLDNAVSISNTCCIIKNAEMYMPNAFHPGGASNYRFRPIPSFVDPSSFTMTIFNKWGQQIFETTDIINGWNGLVDGQLVPPGLYSYIVKYKSVGGDENTKRGTVQVIM